MSKPSERGSAIIMLFIAVALFGMLAFAFMQGSRTSTGWLENESDKAAVTGSMDCSNVVNLAQKRLENRGCASMISFNTDGTNTNPGAPTDGSCSIYHSNGGGVKPCNTVASCSNAQYNALAIGDNCGGIIYAGISPDGGARMYTTLTDGPSLTWDNGTWNSLDLPITNCTGSGASCDTGRSNSIAITSTSNAASPYSAANYCENLEYGGKNDWYLPSQNELVVMAASYSAIGNFQTISYPSIYYWASSEHDQDMARVVRITDGYSSVEFKSYAGGISLRCVRR